MTLQQISREYAASADLLRRRLAGLRRELAAETDPEAIFSLKNRIAQLTPMLTEMNELTQLTAHYYDRGYYRDEKYTMQHITGPAVSKRGQAAVHSGGHQS